MFGKLIKYDLLFGAKRYSVLFILLGGTWLSGLVVSLINNSILSGFFLSLYVILSILFVGAYAITSLQFFWGALSGDESYFNYTIPVRTVSLISSKLAAIWIWGIAMTGALILTWVSLYHTLLFEMGLDVFGVIDGLLGFLITVAVAQFILLTCLVAYSVCLFNTPRLKNTNAGPVVVAVVAYVLAQFAGILQIGIWFLWNWISDSGFLTAVLSDSIPPGQAMAMLDSMRWTMVGTTAVLAPLFFWLTVRTVEKRRSI